MKKLILQITLIVISLVLAYLIYNGIQGPIKFKKELEHRREVVVDKLKDIRDAQIAYRNVYGKYTSSFDTLVDFIMNGEIPIIKLTADPNDTTLTIMFLDTMGYVSVRDSIFHNRENLHPEELMFIPFSDGQQFEMSAGKTDRGGVTVNVIEVFAAHKYFLKGLNLKQNHIDPEDGLRFGSMTDPTTDGNWE
jgi:hypothetical protein